MIVMPVWLGTPRPCLCVCAEGGPEGHEQLRHIDAPQHIEKDYLDTRCRVEVSDATRRHTHGILYECY